MARTTLPVLTFVIPVRNGAATLRRCLESIHAGLGDISAEVIVADNGSTDDSAEIARAAGARVLSLPGHNVSTVRNLAAKAARGELLAFVDADHELGAGWSAAAVTTFQDPAVVAVGALCHAPEKGTWVQQMYDRLRRHQPGTRRVEWLGSGNLVVKRSAFDKVGGFDQRIETCEDVDLCQRLRQAGGQIVAVDALRSVHYGDPRTLTALFAGEMWRGRDNLRVSLRVRPTVRSLPGLAIPVVHLVAMVLVALGLIATPFGGIGLALLGALLVFGLAVLRAVALLTSLPTRNQGFSASAIPQAVAFGLVYNTARSLALVSRTGHAVRVRA